MGNVQKNWILCDDWYHLTGRIGSRVGLSRTVWGVCAFGCQSFNVQLINVPIIVLILTSLYVHVNTCYINKKELLYWTVMMDLFYCISSEMIIMMRNFEYKYSHVLIRDTVTLSKCEFNCWVILNKDHLNVGEHVSHRNTQEVIW